MKAFLITTLFLAATAASTATAQTYRLTEVGQPCGADLTARLGSTRQGPAVQFGVNTRFANGLVLLAIGNRQPAPVPLPGGPCEFLVDPRGTQLARLDGNGNARFGFQIPRALPIRIAFQAVAADITPRGFRVASTDVVLLAGQ